MKQETKYLYVYLSNDGEIRIKTRLSLLVMQEEYIGKIKLETEDD
jgi:hypothetical protein